MPVKPCRKSHCHHYRPCPIHDAQRQPDRRASAAARGYGHRWRRQRAAYLRQHPLCARCLQQGRETPAVVVDHIVPKAQGGLDHPDNYQSLCRRCDNWKKNKYDGGFGNPVYVRATGQTEAKR